MMYRAIDRDGHIVDKSGRQLGSHRECAKPTPART
jgi:hypothetical protein